MQVETGVEIASIGNSDDETAPERGRPVVATRATVLSHRRVAGPLGQEQASRPACQLGDLIC